MDSTDLSALLDTSAVVMDIGRGGGGGETEGEDMVDHHREVDALLFGETTVAATPDADPSFVTVAAPSKTADDMLGSNKPQEEEAKKNTTTTSKKKVVDPNKAKQIRKPKATKKKNHDDDPAAASFFESQKSLGMSVNLKDTVSRSLTAMMADNMIRSAENSQHMGGGGGVGMPTGIPTGIGGNNSPFSVMMGNSAGGSGGSQMMMMHRQSSQFGGGSNSHGGMMSLQGSNSMGMGPQQAPHPMDLSTSSPGSAGLADCTQRVMSLVQQRKESAIGMVMMTRQSSTASNLLQHQVPPPSSATTPTPTNGGAQFPNQMFDPQQDQQQEAQRVEVEDDEMELCVEEVVAPTTRIAVPANKRGKRNRTAAAHDDDRSNSKRPDGSLGRRGSQEADETDDILFDNNTNNSKATSKERATPQPEGGIYDSQDMNDDEEGQEGGEDEGEEIVPVRAKTKTFASDTVITITTKVDIVGESVVDEAAEAESARLAEEQQQEHDELVQRRHEMDRLQRNFLLLQAKENSSTQDSNLARTASSSTTMGSQTNQSPLVTSSMKSQPYPAAAAPTGLDAAARRKALMQRRTHSVFSKVSSEHVEMLKRTNSFDKATAGPVVFDSGKK